MLLYFHFLFLLSMQVCTHCQTVQIYVVNKNKHFLVQYYSNTCGGIKVVLEDDMKERKCPNR